MTASGHPEFAYIADFFYVTSLIILIAKLLIGMEAENRISSFILSGMLVLVLAICIAGNHKLNHLYPFAPGANVTALISGGIPQAGNAAGCTIYFLQVVLPTSIPIDKLSMRLQFPMDVYTFKVGMMPEYPGGTNIGFNEIGRAADGECYIRQSPLVDDPSVRATQTGPGAIRIAGTDVPVGSSILGTFIPYLKRRSFPQLAYRLKEPMNIRVPELRNPVL